MTRPGLVWLAAAAPGIAVVAVVAVVLAVFDVPVHESLLYLAYEVGYIVVPGTLAVLALTGARSLGLREAALGIGAGYGLEIGCFVVAASLGVRGLFPWYPLLAAAVSAPFVRVRAAPSPRSPGVVPWLLAGLMAALVGLLANAILDTPLPRQVAALRGYPVDMLWSTSVTAEAMHHWPLTIPGFAGRPLYYHYFAYLHLAGAGQVTGIDAWSLNFRLFPVWAALALAFELYAVGRAFSGRGAAGLLAAFVLFLSGAFLPWAQPGQAMLHELYFSVTFALGAIVWLPLVLALWLAVSARAVGYRRWGTWVVAIGLVVVAAGAKAPADVVAGTGLAVYALWAMFTKRPLRTILGMLAAIACVFAAAWAVLYRSTNGAVTLKPLATIKGYEPFELIARHVPHVLHWPFWVLVALLLTAKILTAMLPGFAGAARHRPIDEVVFLAAPLGVGMVFLFAFAIKGGSEAYFAWYGEIAGAVLAGLGLDALGRRCLPGFRVPGLVVTAGACFLLVAWLVESPVDPAPKSAWQNVGHGSGETPEYAGFHWVARHTSPDAVLAVDARSTPTSCFQTAFAERRAIIDCYFGFAPEQTLQTVADLRGALPPSLFRQVVRRARINDAVFRGDPAALAKASRLYGMDYVVVDLASGGTAAQVEGLTRVADLVFRNAAVAVFRVRRPA